VGVGTALFYDPLVCGKINSGVLDYLASHDVDSVSSLVGTLEGPRGMGGWSCVAG